MGSNVKRYPGLASVGKNDFEAISTMASDLFFTPSMGITDIHAKR